MTTLRGDANLLAGEYVLGSLSILERRTVEMRAKEDLAFAATIVSWERRLGPLTELITSQIPPDGLWEKIAARLDDELQAPRKRRTGFLEVAELLSNDWGRDAADKLLRDAKRWRGVAIAASLIAGLMAAYAGVSAI